MSDKYIRFRTEETAGPVVNDPRGHGHDVLIPRSDIEAVVLKVLRQFIYRGRTDGAAHSVWTAMDRAWTHTVADQHKWGADREGLYRDGEAPNRPRDIPESDLAAQMDVAGCGDDPERQLEFVLSQLDPDSERALRDFIGRPKSDAIPADSVRQLMDGLRVWTIRHWNDLPQNVREDWGYMVAEHYAAVAGVSFDPFPPDTGTVSAESPDTGNQADAGEDGPVKGASESDVDCIPPREGRDYVPRVTWLDSLLRQCRGDSVGFYMILTCPLHGAILSGVCLVARVGTLSTDGPGIGYVAGAVGGGIGTVPCAFLRYSRGVF